MKLVLVAALLAPAAAWTAARPPFEVPAAVKAAAATAAATACVAVSPALAGDVGAGEKIFDANCAACHAGGQNVIMPEKTLEKDALESYLAGGRNEKAVVTWGRTPCRRSGDGSGTTTSRTP